ncbi:unnamed protein product [Prorocentrum cordatum]|uniref:C2 domain-containing protein n=1 Tax=Prorocentrum cordatum TaxID=2364126 RepID=A0ABN9VAV4_9DINO|nr:unnamed protein product [Polarella glacialis]
MVARLRIHIHGAKGLPAADSNGLSDPFLTGELEGKPKTKFKTEIVPGTLNPTWDQDFVINGFERGDMLSLKVFDYDNMVKAYTVGNDFLGATLMLGEDFYPY